MDIRAKQKDVIQRMLNLNEEKGQDKQGVWKVLVYDRYCQEILSPLIDVSALRKLGITLHLLIGQRRERVPDVPAIYFVQPTQENVDIICRDCSSNLYDSMYLNFSSAVPRPLLEQLARDTIKSSSVRRIQQVHDQYAEFVSLEPHLLTLSHTGSYVTLNNPKDEAGLMAYIDQLVDSLFGIVVTMGQVPIIRCKLGNAAEMVSAKLTARLWEHLRSRNNLLSAGNGSFGTQRPLLVIADRSLDLSGPLHHPWTYQALCNDLLELKSNRCTVPPEPTEGKSKPKVYDMSAGDTFWKDNAGKPFPKVAEAVESRLKDYKKEMDDINEKSGMHNDPSADMSAAFLGNTDDLASAINSLPELQRKKAILDMHTLMATAILNKLKAREIDAFFSLEEDTISKAAVDKSALLHQLTQDAKGTPRDKLRLLLIHFLTTDGSDLDELLSALDWANQSAGDASGAAQPGDIEAIKYLKQFKFIHRLEASAPGPAVARAGKSGGMFGSVMNTVYGQSVTGLTGLLAGVRNLLPTNTDLPLTRLVSSFMDNKPGVLEQAGAKVAYFDPKAKSARPIVGAQGRQAGAFSTALVFVLGGGNYAEYQNLRDFAAKAPPTQSRQVCYGSTEMVSPEGFLEQLATLGAQES